MRATGARVAGMARSYGGKPGAGQVSSGTHVRHRPRRAVAAAHGCNPRGARHKRVRNAR